MKESLSLNQPTQQLILEAYSEMPTKYLRQARRRGAAPSRGVRHEEQDASRQGDGRDQHLDSRIYPYSALGIVKWATNGERKATLGAVIHPYLIITAAPPQFSSRSQLQFTPLAELARAGPFSIKKTHPSHLQIRRSSDQLNIGRLDESEGTSHCIILEMNKKTNFQEEYGSFSISFEEETQSEYTLLSVFEENGRYRIYEEAIKAEATNLHFSYPPQGSLPGSLLVNRRRGYEIKGVHLGNRGGRGLAIRLIRARWQQFGRMTYKGGQLDLAHENIGRKGVQFIAKLSLRRMQELNLQRAGIGSAEVATICRGDYRLADLNLDHNTIGDDGVAHLVGTAWPLEQLSLSKNAISWEGMKLLVQNRWRNMVHIRLDENPIGNKGVRYLVQCDWINATTLCLNKTRVDDSGCDHLRKGVWPHLTQLDLDRNKISINGMASLLHADWKRLSHISLAVNKLGSEGAKKLLLAEWQSLRVIRIEKNHKAGDFSAIKSVKHLMKEKIRWVYIV